ncbi:MAG: cbb3-type cytochrome c oxidase subunit I, partial [Magnetospirillum sp.]|nr:cbb3-type cytochrome c oxidase subunit I [Magnetospirillum sp.]
AAPLVYLRLDVLGLAHRQAFTQMLWYGMPLPPLVMGGGLFWQLTRHGKDWRSPVMLALVSSLAVFALGGVAGFALGVADTRTPSHYHAVIGGVNLALMGLIHGVLLPLMRRSSSGDGWVRAQFLLYGGGQLLHAVGFYLAGMAGVARKTAGVEQGLDSGFKLIAMGAVGLGGAVAVLGGVIFVVQVLGRLGRGEHAHD